MLDMITIFNFAWLKAFYEATIASDTMFGGLEVIVQLIETYLTLIVLIGALLFMLTLFIILFGPYAKRVIGSWF